MASDRGRIGRLEESYPLIGRIDPFDFMTFTCDEIPALLRELSLLRVDPRGAPEALLDKLAALCSRALADSEATLAFVRD